MTREQIEAALARGDLWAAMRNGRYWKLRRNGATQTWKTRPRDYSIPVKCGLKSCTRIAQGDSVAYLSDDNWRDAHFVVTFGADPNEAVKTAQVNVLDRIARL